MDINSPNTVEPLYSELFNSDYSSTVNNFKDLLRYLNAKIFTTEDIAIARLHCSTSNINKFYILILK